jgi:hypothetical protein
MKAGPRMLAPDARISAHLASCANRWRRDQILDAGFNTAVASLVASAIVGVSLIINRSGIVTVSNDAVGLIEMFIVTGLRRIAPELPLYAAATAIFAAALGIWWRAERI